MGMDWPHTEEYNKTYDKIVLLGDRVPDNLG